MTTTSRVRYGQRPFAAGAAVLALTASTLVAGAVAPATSGARSADFATSTTAAARVAMPVVSSVRPGPGRSTGGQRVTLQGANFRDVLGVSFGEHAHGTSIHRVSDHTLTVVTPPSPILNADLRTQGIVNVRVRTRYGRSDPRLVARYCYLEPPTITSFLWPSALTGQRYEVPLTHIDNRKGIWRVSSGRLPAGLSVHGATISGTPRLNEGTEFAASDFAVTFTDRSGQQATGSHSITTERNHWRASTLPLPPDHDSVGLGSLAAVACSAPGACAATGTYRDATLDFRQMLAVQHGDSWSSVSAPLPPGALAYLFPPATLSCAGAGSCVALELAAFPDHRSAPAIATLAGTAWTVTSAPVNSGAQTSVLRDVRCWSAGRCVAVGDDEDGALIDLSTPSGWQLAPDPNGAIAGARTLTAVTCRADGSCLAVGSSADGPIALARTGPSGNWNVTRLPQPADLRPDAAGDTAMAAVDCSAPGSCTAVGHYTSAAGGHAALIETLTDDVWTAESPPLPPDASADAQSDLRSVTCPSASVCIASGTLIVRLVGTTTHVVSTVPEYDLPVALACPSDLFCALAGYRYNPDNDDSVALAGELTGTDVVTQLAPLPADAKVPHYDDGDPSSLRAVSCADSTYCVAVGTYTTSHSTIVPAILTYVP